MRPYYEHGGVRSGRLPPRGGRIAGTLDLNSAQMPEWDKFDPGWLGLWPGPAAVFCSVPRLLALNAAMGADGMLIYVKSNPNPLGSSYEPCLTRGFSSRGPQHIVAYNAFTGQEHPTQKPIEVMQFVILRAPPGVVLDPFMGSGTTLLAAKTLGRRAIGVEICEEYCEIAALRLQQEVLLLFEPEVAPRQQELTFA
jgi:DNA methylase